MNNKCQKCQSVRVAYFMAHCSDSFHAKIGEFRYEGYVPSNTNIGGGDDMEVEICLDCGQTQGEWPVKFPRDRNN